jgi:pimeloyl-ACP methyl ester carboxylesterase
MIIRIIITWILRIIVIAVVLFVVILGFFRILSLLRESKTYHEAAPATGRFIQAGDVEMFVQEKGNASSTALVFIHGTGAWSETWKPTMNELSSQGFRTIALDMPPFGYSQKPNAGSYDRQSQAKRIIAALDALQLKDVILVGHSFGGGATVEAALMAPERIRGLVLVDVALGLTQEVQPSMLTKAFLKMSFIKNAFLSTTVTNPLFTRTLLKMFIENPADATDKWVSIYQLPMRVKGATRGVGAWLPSLLTQPAPSLSTDTQQYNTITTPTLIIWGEKDTITPLEQGQHLSGIIPEAELQVMIDVGHIPQIEDPVNFYKELNKFLVQYK